MKTTVVIIIFIFSAKNLVAQIEHNQNLDVTSAFGKKDISTAISYEYNFELGKQKKIEIGIGARGTYYNGKDKEYITALPELTKGKTSPTIFFKTQQSTHLDTIYVQNPQIAA